MKKLLSAVFVVVFAVFLVSCVGKEPTVVYPKEEPKEVAISFLKGLFGGNVKKVLSSIYIEPKIADNPSELDAFEANMTTLVRNTYHEMQNSSLTLNFEALETNIDKDRAEVIVVIYSHNEVSYTRIVKLILSNEKWRVLFQ